MSYNNMPHEKRLLFELHAKLPAFKRKVEQAQQVVAKALNETNNSYCALSSGKDSLITSHLVWSVNPGIPGVYNDSQAGFPDCYSYLDRVAQHHTVIKWQCEPFLDVYERMGGPLAKGAGNAIMEAIVYKPIREVLAEYQFDGVFLGLRREESEARANTVKYHGQIYRYKRDDVVRYLPVAFFSYRDIWAYVVQHNLEYNRVYDKMWNMPERQQRVADWPDEELRTYGRYVFLKLHYPELWNKFAPRFPEVRQFC